jgi:hypothetical protein
VINGTLEGIRKEELQALIEILSLRLTGMTLKNYENPKPV